MTIVETLRATRAVLERRGWCQKFRFDHTTGRCCLVGALELATNDALDAAVARRALTEIIQMHPAVWNDTPGRTVEEVYALIDRAIAAQKAAK